MALELDWRQCKENKYAEALGFYMMFTELGWELTEKNAEDFYVRCMMHYKLFGPIWHYPDAPFCVTPQIIKDYIGLKANVAPKTFAKFSTSLVNCERSELQRTYREAHNV